jgi:hypothetical protein
MSDPEQTSPAPGPFDFGSFPDDTLFHDRREGRERRRRGAEAERAGEASVAPRPPAERRAKKERRRRIDPTTFEKQYTDDEMEFMNAMQRFKVQSGKGFPSHGDVLRVAFSLGYRKVIVADDEPDFDLAVDDVDGSDEGDAVGLSAVRIEP